MKLSSLSALLVLLVAPASAQIVSQSPFSGNEQEQFATTAPANQSCLGNRVFNNRGDLCATSGSAPLISSGWSFMCFVSPYSPPLMCGSASTKVVITLDQPISRFGGRFATHSPTPDANFEFYDASGALLHTELASVPNDCQWRWLGWRVAGGPPIARIVIDSVFGGAFILMDDLEADFPAAAPQPYCTSGASSSGCQPTINANANPSATYSNSCSIQVSGLDGQRNGAIFYGLQPLPQLWCISTGTSYLCVRVPTYRSIAQSSGGTAGACDGAMALDWNGFMQANPSALGQPWVVGDKAYFQCWYRDPGSCRFSSMSDAVELTVGP